MPLLVDPEKCTACGACEASCPFEAIRVEGDLAKVNDACTLCGACLEACPVEALSIPEKQTQAGQGLDGYRGVWVFCEQRRGELHSVGLELLGRARTLADDLGQEVTAVLFGHRVDGLGQALVDGGADQVLVVDHPSLARFTDDAYGQVLAGLISERKPAIVLCGATALGRSFFPRVATTIGTGLTADCTELSIDPEKKLLLQTRPAFGGNIMATIICPNHRPQMATVRPKVMKRLTGALGRRGRVVQVDPPAGLQALSRVVDSVVETSQQARLVEAEIIVTAGRGIRGPENLPLIKELASLLGGALGATRGVVDSGWLPYAHQVGQTGRTVSPKLYVAVGVSGAVQHVVGMQSSQVIVAINSDPQAPIFDVATYGLVGDLFKVVPAMINRLKTAQGAN
jgi:electron transfer flavoprotein alpha subunit